MTVIALRLSYLMLFGAASRGCPPTIGHRLAAASPPVILQGDPENPQHPHAENP